MAVIKKSKVTGRTRATLIAERKLTRLKKIRAARLEAVRYYSRNLSARDARKLEALEWKKMQRTLLTPVEKKQLRILRSTHSANLNVALDAAFRAGYRRI